MKRINFVDCVMLSRVNAPFERFSREQIFADCSVCAAVHCAFPSIYLLFSMLCPTLRAMWLGPIQECDKMSVIKIVLEVNHNSRHKKIISETVGITSKTFTVLDFGIHLKKHFISAQQLSKHFQCDCFPACFFFCCTIECNIAVINFHIVVIENAGKTLLKMKKKEQQT